MRETISSSIACTPVLPKLICSRRHTHSHLTLADNAEQNQTLHSQTLSSCFDSALRCGSGLWPKVRTGVQSHRSAAFLTVYTPREHHQQSVRIAMNMRGARGVARRERHRNPHPRGLWVSLPVFWRARAPAENHNRAATPRSSNTHTHTHMCTHTRTAYGRSGMCA